MADIINVEPLLVGFNGDPSHTAVYSVPSAAMTVLQDVINATWNEGLASKAEFTAKITAALAGFLDITAAPHVASGSVTVPTITEPSITIPTSQSAGDVITVFDTKRGQIVAELIQKFSDFRTSFFPDESNAYVAAENWLQAAIADPLGLPPAVRAALVGEDEARILGDKVRAQDSVVAQFAGRRFPLPPDVAASAVLQIEQKAQDELAESSRKLLLLSVDMQKFNVEKLLGLRGMAMDSAIKYISALASGQDIASKVVGVGYDAESKFITSISSLLNARSQVAETISKVAQYNNSTALEAATKNQAADMQMVENKLKALLTEAQAIAQMCTSLFNNLHASVGLSTSGGSSVNTSLA